MAHKTTSNSGSLWIAEVPAEPAHVRQQSALPRLPIPVDDATRLTLIRLSVRAAAGAKLCRTRPGLVTACCVFGLLKATCVRRRTLFATLVRRSARRITYPTVLALT